MKVPESAGDGSRPRSSVSFKSVALPAEHGSWSLVLEPILLGLLIGPSWAGLAFAVGAFFAFLAHRPLKIAWGDRQRGRSYERTGYAWRWGIAYAAISLAGLIAGLILAGWRPFVPLALAVPFMLVFAVFAQKPGRSWQAELAAPAGISAVVAAITLADGMAWTPSLALWGAMIARSVPAVLFVRARLRLDKGKEVAPNGAIAAHVIGLLAVAAMVWVGWLPWTAALALAILLGRCIWGLSDYRWRSSVKQLGFLETFFGFLTVFLIAAGFWMGY